MHYNVTPVAYSLKEYILICNGRRDQNYLQIS